MKIKGLSDFAYRRTFTFETLKDASGNNVSIQLTALPYGWDADGIRELGGQPQPPVRKVGEKDGQPIWRTIEEDQDYQARKMEFSALQVTMMVYLSIKDDSTVEFDTPEEMRKTAPLDFWRAIYGELKATGWPSLEIGRMIEAIQRLSDVSDTGMDEARGAFLSKGS